MCTISYIHNFGLWMNANDKVLMISHRYTKTAWFLSEAQQLPGNLISSYCTYIFFSCTLKFDLRLNAPFKQLIVYRLTCPMLNTHAFYYSIDLQELNACGWMENHTNRATCQTIKFIFWIEITFPLYGWMSIVCCTRINTELYTLRSMFVFAIVRGWLDGERDFQIN